MDNQDNQNQRPRPRRRRRRKNKSLTGYLIVLIVLLIAFFAFLIYNFMGGGEDKSAETTTVTEQVTTENTNTEETPTPSNEAATNANGEINTIGSETDIDGLKQTLNSATVSNTIGTTSAPEGQMFFQADWTINNTTATELSVNPNNYVVYANGNQAPRVEISDPSIQPLIASTVPAGGSISGTLVYQIPSDWNEVQIYSHINPTVNKEVEYRITSDQL